ncbi:hypothetical protein BDV96DRAFT_607201 [Lophiotrema nucula]|uniref:Uncharacterized protein n=1 Tax=Lophiotrema nucula TaxID=690887 RepID=A0A6A5YIC3_9PLEO|nr:hypothetical protein BDV96DRAFT_607201 [Lophiotrema nucula]
MFKPKKKFKAAAHVALVITRASDIMHDPDYDNAIPEPPPEQTPESRNPLPASQYNTTNAQSANFSSPSYLGANASYYGTSTSMSGQPVSGPSDQTQYWTNQGPHPPFNHQQPGYPQQPQNYGPQNTVPQHDPNTHQQHQPYEPIPQQQWNNQYNTQTPASYQAYDSSSPPPPLPSSSPYQPMSSPDASYSHNTSGGPPNQQGSPYPAPPPRAHTVPYGYSPPEQLQRSATIAAPSYTHQDPNAFSPPVQSDSYGTGYPPPLPPNRALTYEDNSSYNTNSAWDSTSQSTWGSASEGIQNSQRVWGEGGYNDF